MEIEVNKVFKLKENCRGIIEVRGTKELCDKIRKFCEDTFEMVD